MSALDRLIALQQEASATYLDVVTEWHELAEGWEKDAAWALVQINLDVLHALRAFRPTPVERHALSCRCDNCHSEARMEHNFAGMS